MAPLRMTPPSSANNRSMLPLGAPSAATDGRTCTPPYGSSSGPQGHQEAMQVGTSIRLLEESKWRVILEHGPLGDVVAVAAFAPGPGDTTPNTPATPSGLANLAMSSDNAFDMALQNGMQQARARCSNSAGGGGPLQQQLGGGAMGGYGASQERNLWVNANIAVA